MAKQNWKRVRPSSLRHAMELCIKHAREKKNLSVENVSDLLGLAGHWTLYKWMESGRMPSNLIRPFEHACGIEFMTQYIATSAHKLLIDVPSGRASSAEDINELQASFSEAVGLLINFYKSQNQDQLDNTLAALNSVMSDIAYHRENVSKVNSPELNLF